jgi:S-(hydroxymethyl)glutathione dehydrogenase/alcohol dehydrogenase
MPTKVRAAVAYGVGEPLRIEELELADPGAGEVQVKLFASGLCHSDLHCLDGQTPSEFPVVLGHEGIGEVVALGAGVTDFAIGDQVVPFLIPDCGVCPLCRSGRTNACVELLNRHSSTTHRFSRDGQPIRAFVGLGTFAEQIVVTADMLAKVTRGARPDHACCIGCGVTTGIGAALIAAKVTPGSSVAVFGVGGVGLSVVQGARMAGARQIIAVDINPTKEAVARKMGATAFIDANVTDNVVGSIFALTGFGVDFAFECVGVPKLAMQALECTNPTWGLALNVGIMPSGSTLNVQPMSLQGGRRWGGVAMGGAKRQDVARYVDLYMAGEIKLDDLVSHRLNLDEINHGFTMMRTGETVRSVILYD